MLKLMLMLLISISYVRANISESNHSVDQCHTWSFYNDTLEECQCYDSPALPLSSSSTRHDFVVQCSESKVVMNVRFCMTNEEAGTFIGECEIYSLNKNAELIDGVYVQLPNNVSELNDYMCGPMNRKGRICSECIDGFAPSVTSVGYICSNCTGAWYGVPLYLLLEFVPITLFYILVLVCQISVTSSPLTYCIFYSQVVVYAFSDCSMMDFYKSTQEMTLVKILLTLHGIWNLEFFHYILPPFCVSPNLKFIHVLLLKYISALYPVLLIALTWLVIEMHSHNFKPIVWLWDKINCRKINNQSNTTVIDIFATFFLLSYTKLCFTSMVIFWHIPVYNANDSQYYNYIHIDPTIVFFGKEHILYAIIAALVLLVFGVLPALLLVAYPIRILRSFFLINRLSGRSKVSLNIFVEKFYSCYRDGLDGGKDMRSFASLHLIIRLFSSLFGVVSLSMGVIFFGGCCLLIFLFKPCKQNYMNNIDACVLALIALNLYQADKIKGNSIYSDVHLWSLRVVLCLPLFITYGIFFPTKYLTKLKAIAENCKVCKNSKQVKLSTAQQHDETRSLLDSDNLYNIIIP